MWLSSGSSVVRSSPSPRDGGDPWQPCGVSPSLWDGCSDSLCSPWSWWGSRSWYLAKQGGKSRDFLVSPGGIVKLEPRCGAVSERGLGDLTPKQAMNESHSWPLKESSESARARLLVMHPVRLGKWEQPRD